MAPLVEHFRWQCTESSLPLLDFAVMKTHLPSESTHVPEDAERELRLTQ
jgi:hypothetical protein